MYDKLTKVTDKNTDNIYLLNAGTAPENHTIEIRKLKPSHIIIIDAVEFDTTPGSIIKNQKLVGNNAFVGMGAVVTDDVPNNMVVAGVPARALREKRENDI